MLALDDLIAFSIHARRLIENTIGPKRAKETHVQALFEDRMQSVPITSIINCIVHNRHLLVVRSLESIYYASLVRDQKLHLNMRQEDLRKPLDPFCSVTSDKGRNYIFGIAQAIETFGPKILDPIIDLCAEKMLFLERFD
jgi:hypothetical protein